MTKRSTTLIWIAVHQCEVCGDHAKEHWDQWLGYPNKPCKRSYVDSIVLRTCDTCGLLACHIWMDDGYCCDRRAEIESEGKPQRGQGTLFDERLLMQDGAEPESAKET